MDATDLVADILAITGFVVAVIGGLFVARAAKESKTSEVWRSEAEAQKARADRLHNDLSTMTARMARVEAENKHLVEIVSAPGPGVSDPEGLTGDWKFRDYRPG